MLPISHSAPLNEKSGDAFSFIVNKSHISLAQIRILLVNGKYFDGHDLGAYLGKLAICLSIFWCTEVVVE